MEEEKAAAAVPALSSGLITLPWKLRPEAQSDTFGLDLAWPSTTERDPEKRGMTDRASSGEGPAWNRAAARTEREKQQEWREKSETLRSPFRANRTAHVHAGVAATDPLSHPAREAGYPHHTQQPHSAPSSREQPRCPAAPRTPSAVHSYAPAQALSFLAPPPPPAFL